MATLGEIRLATQGWSYKDWVGAFYPDGMAATDYLGFYSRVFDCVELDTTFYGPPRAETVRTWDEATPAGFEFAAKMPRAITHDKRLVEVEPDLVEFLTAMSCFRPKLGPVLIQLPPSFEADDWETFKNFIAILPEEFKYAVEFRHESWLTQRTEESLAQRGLAWTVVDHHYMPREVRFTADFAYVRWLGRRSDVKRLDRVQIDRSKDLEFWARELDRIAQKVQRIYGFMNNHYAGHAPASINELRRNLRLPVIEPDSLWPERQLVFDV